MPPESVGVTAARPDKAWNSVPAVRVVTPKVVDQQLPVDPLRHIALALHSRFVAALVAKRPKLFVEDFDGPWLGGFQADSRSEPRGGWAWVTGEPFRYAACASGQPNDVVAGDDILEPGIPEVQQEGFLRYIGKAGRWNDLNVNALPHGCVVEFDAGRRKACASAAVAPRRRM